MKRFYTAASRRRTEAGHAILLDERPVKTPARAGLVVESERLADAIAAEWNAQSEEIKPHSMPLTGLANAAIDRVAADRDAFVRSLALFGESDLLCYRAEGPDSLVQRQEQLWDPILDWAKRRFDVNFEIVAGIIHRPQPQATLDRLHHAVAVHGPFALAGLAPLVTIGGSLIAALALAEDAITLEAAWAASSLDEAWQAEQWGEDAEAAQILEARRQEFAAGYRFLKLL